MNFYFYDLETSGISAKTARIMQFAGQRTDSDFNPIGEPHNWLVKLSDEVLPDPEAILVHGVSPQKAAEEGYTEAEFLKLFNQEVLQPNTIIMGFNSIRFDDEFMRYTLWRNFHDPYEWQWQDHRSRWDLIDAVRMTRALRPAGIEWPTGPNGKPSNRLELLTKANGISHEDAHDALSDVNATIDLAKLLKDKQPKIFDFLLQNRGKRDVAKLLDVNNPTPVVHTSGQLSNEWAKTTVVLPFAKHPTNPGVVLVYDLRYNPDDFAALSVDELRERIFSNSKELEAKKLKRLPVKGVYLNRAPAVAPLGVLDESTRKRIKLSLDRVESHKKKLAGHKGFAQRVHDAFDGQGDFPPSNDVDQQLYDGFVPDTDKKLVQQVRNRSAEQLKDFKPKFEDERLAELYLRYKARNYPDSLTEAEQEQWAAYVQTRMAGNVVGATGLESFGKRLYKLSQSEEVMKDQNKQFLLEELQLYAQGLMEADL